MIKCNVTVCGTVSRAAVCRTGKEGREFVGFAVSVVIPAKSGINKTVEVSVIRDGALRNTDNLNVGNRVKITGMLVPKKRGENICFNLKADNVSPATEEEADGIQGEMEFRGKTGNKIEEKRDKKDKPYVTFSAFSAEKVNVRAKRMKACFHNSLQPKVCNDGFEYLWVRFFYACDVRPDWLAAGKRMNAKGAMTIRVYNDRLDISCRAGEISEYIPEPYNGI